MTTPYTYFIKNKTNNKKYYGVKYSKGCHPDTFFKDYFTSSKIIRNIITQFGVDVFEYKIHKTFKTAEEACAFEHKFIKKIKAHLKSDWYNMQVGANKPILYSKGCDPWNKGISNINMKGKRFYNNGKIQKMLFEYEVPPDWKKGRLNDSWNKGLDINDIRVKKNAESTKKTKSQNPQVAWNKGLTKENNSSIMNYAIKGSEPIECPHCKLIGGKNVMRRFHFNNCKLLLSDAGLLDKNRKKAKAK